MKGKRTTYRADLDLADAMASHFDAPTFATACKACRNYGKTWVCPPFDYNPEEKLKDYKKVMFFADVIDLPQGTLLNEVQAMIAPYKKEIRRRMLDMEKMTGGHSCILAGKCDDCEPLSCARLEGNKCRHPELSRPSLEAYGFNLSTLIDELFGLSFTWSNNEFAPSTLILVTAHFYSGSYVFPAD